MLLQIRDYICRQDMVSLQQLAREFYMDEKAIQPMLDLWVKKGVIQAVENEGDCKTKCSKCGPKAVTTYYQIKRI